MAKLSLIGKDVCIIVNKCDFEQFYEEYLVFKSELKASKKMSESSAENGYNMHFS